MTAAPPLSPPLPRALLEAPIAHRGLHGLAAGTPENSPAAFEAAIAHGYGIELDVQMSADGRAMVFHDYGLGRLTGEKGPLRQRTAAELGAIALNGGGGQGIPTLAEVLELVAGRVPLLIEVKDQDGAMGLDTGTLEAAVARDMDGYSGEAALMSFNPHAVAHLARLMPERPRGLTTCAYMADNWPTLPAKVRARLSGIPDYAATGASFISHNYRALDMDRVAELRAEGADVLCWTITTPQDANTALTHAQNITFEGYLPG